MKINIGKLTIGGDYIPIQSMIKNPVTEVDKTIQKIERLANIGCDIIRITVPDETAVSGLREVLKNVTIPVVADIHFDYKLAIMAIEAGVHKVRINPGNIGGEEKVKKVIDCLKEHNIPVRIGINGGSLPKHLKEKYVDNVKTMLEAAKEEVGYFDKYGYDKIVLSFKSSNVLETIEINTLAKKEFGFPLHIGVTEAGDKIDGTVKNSIGVGHLLLNNIGDTIRVSLTAPEEDEVLVGKKILESVGRRSPELEIISCPTCGRTEVNIENLVSQVKQATNFVKLKQRIKIAIMGCVVNGPGEASSANFGVACGKDKSIIFKDGKNLKNVNNTQILDELLNILKEYY
ncbi:MAG: 4-hydroxy-3-methylbut-2-en-1-yl diphosphate synthase [Spirochaetes bacterium GWD1_27_9]|nr:MAG: 4-hydroxy-3-methylbut-2-en-1-yl diphosphate synthase [Spirochaetes bacterium GWC1_27_15]OHD41245.1 MAG: 4-hydroxy-3-methylbut-2-en-1-yl diphosphate synthase [Spirochaetes bacterium GWD1_27_9]